MMFQEPAQTLNYMLAGFFVIFGMMGFYLFSLVVRRQKLERELKHIQEIMDATEES